MQKTINIEDNGNREFTNVAGLIETLEYWKHWAFHNNKLTEFLNLPISLNLYDINGQIVEGRAHLNVGWSGENFVILGNAEQLLGETERMNTANDSTNLPRTVTN